MIIDEAQVRRQLVGLSQYLAAIGDATAQTGLIEEFITVAEAKFERDLRISLTKKVIKMQPSPSLTKGTDYDIEEPAFNYIESDWMGWPSFKTRIRPIQSVDRVAVQFQPNDYVITIPVDFARPQKDLGVISLVPSGTGAAVVVGVGVPLLTFIAGGMRQGYVPQFVCIDYTAGYDEADDPDKTPELSDLRHALAKETAYEVLTAISEGLYPGAGALSNIDGFGRTIPTGRFEPRLKRLREDIDKFMKSWTEKKTPPRMVVM